jgi:hypothetical protein
MFLYSCWAELYVSRTFTDRELPNFIIVDTTSVLLILHILTNVLIKTIPLIHHYDNITSVSLRQFIYSRLYFIEFVMSRLALGCPLLP